MVSSIEVKGWIELQGKRISENELKNILAENADAISKFGGEFSPQMEWM